MNNKKMSHLLLSNFIVRNENVPPAYLEFYKIIHENILNQR